MDKSTIYYVIGASGAGKDTLMQYAREKIGGNFPVLFAHRYITRPANAGGENHIYLSTSEFLLRKSENLFAMDWESHGNHYGIGTEILQWMKSGFNVIINGSRAYLPEASSLFPEMKVILVEVSEAVLQRRLEARGRENSEEIEKRIEHSRQFKNIAGIGTTIIPHNNDRDLESSGPAFTKLLIQESSSFV